MTGAPPARRDASEGRAPLGKPFYAHFGPDPLDIDYIEKGAREDAKDQRLVPWPATVLALCAEVRALRSASVGSTNERDVRNAALLLDWIEAECRCDGPDRARIAAWARQIRSCLPLQPGPSEASGALAGARSEATGGGGA